jgi:hypothetical protein
MGSPLEYFDLVIGFDTEYVADHPQAFESEELLYDPATTEGRIKRGNRVLTISFAVLNPHSGERRSVAVDWTPVRSKRWSLATTMSLVVRSAIDSGTIEQKRVGEAEKRRKKPKTLKIALAAHFTRADLCAFADFKTLKKKFDGVRKTYATVERPHKFECRPKYQNVIISVTLFDTRLLAPAGYGSLAALGDMLGRAKLTLPDVETEIGDIVSGITRMDLVQEHHPDLYAEYAKRDAEITVDYLENVAALVGEWGLSKMPLTLGSLAVNKFYALADENDQDADAFVGRVIDETSKSGRKMKRHPVLDDNASFLANTFHGARNEAYAHGVFEPTTGRSWQDIDVSGAYTSAMAGLLRVDWDSGSHTKDLNKLATLDAATHARVYFRFPDGTRFPNLPVVTENKSLLFPMEGEAYCVGPELVVALNMGAEIIVQNGMRFEFFPGSDGRMFAGFSEFVAAERKKYKETNPLREKMVKEVGNSLYGKTGQAIASQKSVGKDTRKNFDTRTGGSKDLITSKISNAVLAAQTTGWLRALISEIMENLPASVLVLSATTDGFLCDATMKEAKAACNGPVAKRFKFFSELIGRSEILEVKHTAASVLVLKTRGAFSVEPDKAGDKPIMARAGHRLEERPEDPWDEARCWVDLFKNRTPDFKLKGRDFISTRDQWNANADLVPLYRDIRLNFDFDMKTLPVDPIEVEGTLNFRTRPWQHIKEHTLHRGALDKMRADGGQLKTHADYLKFQKRVEKLAPRMNGKASFDKMTVGLWIHELHGREGFTYKVIADVLQKRGFPKMTKEGVRRLKRKTNPKQANEEGVKPTFNMDDLSGWSRFNPLIATPCISLVNHGLQKDEMRGWSPRSSGEGGDHPYLPDADRPNANPTSERRDAVMLNEGFVLTNSADMSEAYPCAWSTPNAAKIWRRRSRRFGAPNEDGRTCPIDFVSGLYRKRGRGQKEYTFHVNLKRHPSPEVWLNENIGPMKFVRVLGCPCSPNNTLT